MTSISQRIEQLRSKKGLSRQALAEALGFPKTSIEKFETGRLTPNQEQQKAIAAFFGVSTEYLRGESDDPVTLDNWLSGELPEEEPVVVRTAVKRTVIASAEGKGGDPAPLTAMLKSDAFKLLVRETVIDVLNSKEGRQIIENVIKRNER